MSRIEPLFIITTKKGTKITNYEQEIITLRKEGDIYSSIVVEPDETYTNIKSIKGVYNYGRKMNNRFRCSFADPDPIPGMNGSGDSLCARLQSLFNTILLDESFNHVIMKGIKAPGSSEQQKFINSFVSGISTILCVFDFIKQQTTHIYS